MICGPCLGWHGPKVARRALGPCWAVVSGLRPSTARPGKMPCLIGPARFSPKHDGSVPGTTFSSNGGDDFSEGRRMDGWIMDESIPIKLKLGCLVKLGATVKGKKQRAKMCVADQAAAAAAAN